jgi:hypothetical protein
LSPKDRLKEKQQTRSAASSKAAAAAVRAELPKEKKRPGRPAGTTEAAQAEKRVENSEIFTKENIRFYCQKVNEVLATVEMNCTEKEIDNFIEPLHRVANKKWGNAKFLNTDEGQLAFIALMTFGPKIPKGVKAIRGKFGRSRVRNVEDGENVFSQSTGAGTRSGNIRRSDESVPGRSDLPDDGRPAGIL